MPQWTMHMLCIEKIKKKWVKWIHLKNSEERIAEQCVTKNNCNARNSREIQNTTISTIPFHNHYPLVNKGKSQRTCYLCHIMLSDLEQKHPKKDTQLQQLAVFNTKQLFLLIVSLNVTFWVNYGYAVNYLQAKLKTQRQV